MLRLYHVLLGFILIPVGATAAASYFSANKKSAPAVTTTPTAIASAKSDRTNIWKNLIKETQLPPGWKINPCEENNSLLCVSANEKQLGTVEIEVLPLKTQPKFQKMLLNAGIPFNANVNYLNPKYTPQVTTALNSWVKDRYNLLAKSRKYVYDDKLKTAKTADGILFSPYPPEKAWVGKLPGIRYGFAGIKQQGDIQEQHIGYVAFDGKALYLINTAFNATSPTGFEKLDNLSLFQPYLNAVVANLKLPN